MDLVQRAKQVALPSWATHVAITTDGSRAEPCAWVEELGEYFDRDPDTMIYDLTIGYVMEYWTFFSRNELE